MTEEPGQLIAGRYLLGRCLARGGMGSVWEAKHVELETRLAVKLLRAELGEDSGHVERFRREARAAAKLKSPHVVAIYDCGIDHGTPFIAMEYLEGEDLELRLGRLGRLEPNEAFAWLDQAARGLATAHAAGLVHRDVKPANLFVERLPHGERLKVVDFGIARPSASESTLTTGGGVWGSPAYMSPEQARGRTVDERTDVWALACVFYRMLTGQRPFPGVTEHDTIVLVCTGTARPPSEVDPELPAALDEFFARAFAKEPVQRTASVELLVQEAADALGQTAAPFELPSSRPSTAPPGEPTRQTPSGPVLGRVTETKPLTGDTGPTPVTAPSSLGEGSSSRRRGLAFLALGALALGGALLWSSPRRAPAPADASEENPRADDAQRAPSHAPTPEAAPAAASSESASRAVDSAATAPVSATEGPRAPARTKVGPPSGKPTHAPEAASTQPKRPSTKPTDPLFGLPLEGEDAP